MSEKIKIETRHKALKRASYAAIDKRLQRNMSTAYKARTTEQSGQLAALAVAKEAHDLYRNGELASVIYGAATEAVAPVVAAFDADDRAFKEARHRGHGIADRYLRAALHAVRMDNADAIAERLTTKPIAVKDLAHVAAKMGGMEGVGIDVESLFANTERVKELMRGVVGDDHPLGKGVDDLYFDGAEPLSVDEQDGLEIRSRLGSATWRSGELIDAKRKDARGEDGRSSLDPSKTSTAHSLDQYLVDVYRGFRREGKTEEQAFLGTLWKGLITDGPVEAVFQPRDMGPQDVGALAVRAF